MKNLAGRFLFLFVLILFLFLSVNDGSAASEPYMVKDINDGSNGSSIDKITNVNGIIYFEADDGIHGRELWKSDGTEAGTVMVKDINPGSSDAGPYRLTNVNGTLFFVAQDATHGYELWKTDGTETGTVMVKDITTSGPNYGIANLTAVNGTLFFTHPSGWCCDMESPELWRSDGTADGTIMVKDINPLNNHWGPMELFDLNGLLVFNANDTVWGYELWKSDGTEAGTTMIKDTYPGPLGSGPDDQTIINGTMYYRNYEPTHGSELWKTDGTLAGTEVVKDIIPGSGNSSPQYITAVDDMIFFIRYNSSTGGQDLWKSDGTETGTVLVISLLSAPNYFGSAGDLLFFKTNLSGFGIELWKSDGTEAGTKMVKDIREGPGSSSPDEFTDVNGMLYFRARDLTHGTELWQSDGTEAGTVMVSDMYPGSFSGGPSELTNVDGTLFFRGEEGINGDELWALKLADSDGDGLADPVDGEMVGNTFVDESNLYSDNFTDENIDGTSFGYIQTRSDLTVTVEDAAHPDGLLVKATGGGGTAHVRVCDISPPVGRLNLTDGDIVLVTCGSLKMQVLAGPVEVVLGEEESIVITAPIDAVILITESDDGQVQVENLPESKADVTIEIDGDVTVLEPEEKLQSVAIDIMPGGATGCINTKKKGAIPVAILGSVDFDPTLIDPSTCSLEGLGVSTKGKKNKPLARIVDINNDGYDDLMLQFANQPKTFEEGQTSASLTGETIGGDAISGSGTVCILP